MLKKPIIFSGSLLFLQPRRAPRNAPTRIAWGETAALETERPAPWARTARLAAGDWLAAYGVFGKDSECRSRVRISSDKIGKSSSTTDKIRAKISKLREPEGSRRGEKLCYKRRVMR